MNELKCGERMLVSHVHEPVTVNVCVDRISGIFTAQRLSDCCDFLNIM